ncbi:P-loop containing nucleoside triphosphate hydrolase protein [Thelephora ganbajun]|uniref:P-loop containing nucleoside triphosphate hydrolase protein n=1 Tax=Thelephora ganbajun TaxID=370292 RepID=A0ACB6ZSK5_THEGA|nr:P-loop containing nucleoside triphosphate hydrolase protein [Thelephora ganbajun]
MPLVRIEVCDFKSYRGHQTIGPFRNFTSVIGPNGAGKSNLMDAISFVLGVKSAQLRSSQLKDLVYRGRKLAAPPDEPSEQNEEDEEPESSAKKAWVLAVFHDGEKEWLFQRIISTTGTSEYKLNGRTISYSAYNAALVSHNILVKAKNFLVFQGDVEAVASQSPKELTRLIEQISGSLELAPEYEKAKEAQERATENATFNFTKRRGITGEIRQYKEQKNEVDRYERLCQQKDELILRRVLYKLYHIEESLKANASEIQKQSRALNGLREDQHRQQQALDRTRTEQAKSKTEVSREERKLKRAEKTLEAKRPELVTAEAQISHATRKKVNSAKLKEQVTRDVEKKQEKITAYYRDLEIVRQEADRVQGEISFCPSSTL